MGSDVDINSITVDDDIRKFLLTLFKQHLKLVTSRSMTTTLFLSIFICSLTFSFRSDDEKIKNENKENYDERNFQRQFSTIQKEIRDN